MQYQSPLISHSPSCYTCPPSGLRSKAPVFAFNTGLYDPGPNEIDPLDLSCLSDDQSSKTRASGDFTFPTHSLAIVRPPFEQQRYSSASYSSTHTPSLSDYTETPSILGSTPSPVLLRTPRSPPLLDLKYLDPLRDRQRFTPNLYRKTSSGDENGLDTIASRNKFVVIREAEDSLPVRFSTSTIRPDPPSKMSLKPRREAAPSGRLLDAFNERMDVGEVIWVNNDDVNVKGGYPDELCDNSRAFAPRNLLRRGAVCRASTGHHSSSMEVHGIPLLCMEDRHDIPPRPSCPTPSGVPSFTSIPYIHYPDSDEEDVLNDDCMRPESRLSLFSNISHVPITDVEAL